MAEKNRVGFGCTEVSVWPDGIVRCAFSSGHGPGGRGFEGFWESWGLHDSW